MTGAWGSGSEFFGLYRKACLEALFAVSGVSFSLLQPVTPHIRQNIITTENQKPEPACPIQPVHKRQRKEDCYKLTASLLYRSSSRSARVIGKQIQFPFLAERNAKK